MRGRSGERVPYASLADDEIAGIMNLLRISNNRALSILVSINPPYVY